MSQYFAVKCPFRQSIIQGPVISSVLYDRHTLPVSQSARLYARSAIRPLGCTYPPCTSGVPRSVLTRPAPSMTQRYRLARLLSQSARPVPPPQRPRVVGRGGTGRMSPPDSVLGKRVTASRRPSPTLARTNYNCTTAHPLSSSTQSLPFRALHCQARLTNNPARLRNPKHAPRD